ENLFGLYFGFFDIHKLPQLLQDFLNGFSEIGWFFSLDKSGRETYKIVSIAWHVVNENHD
ncbi:hypothetical protein LCGC14_2300490, partial [marine sediment metagenome]